MTPRFHPPDPGALTSRGRTDALIGWARASGLLYPGDGRDLGPAAGLTYDVSRLSGSAGLILAMHLSQAHCLRQIALREPVFGSLLDALSAQGGLIASVVSEPASGGDIAGGRDVLVREGGRVRIVKSTFNTSYLPQAAGALISAVDPAQPRPVPRIVLAFRDQIAATPGPRHRTMGMRGIDNRPWRLKVHVPEEQVAALPLAAIARSEMVPATHILWSACWSGIVAGALERAAQALDGAEAGALSELRARHGRLNGTIGRALADHLAGPAGPLDLDRTVAINRLKVFASEEAVALVVAAQGLIGFRGWLDTGPLSLSEALRDVLSGPVMVSNRRLREQVRRLEGHEDARP